jgi:hypothetical protein
VAMTASQSCACTALTTTMQPEQCATGCRAASREHTTQHRTSQKGCRAFVTEALLNHIPPDSIVSRVREQLHEEYMVAHKLPSIACAAQAMQVS